MKARLNFGTMLLAAMLLLGAGINSAFAQSVCVCTGSACGNNAVGGDAGDIFTKISPESVKGSFQTSSSTGWTCFTPAKVRGAGGPLGCFCKGYCGNGGVGADPNYVDLGLSQDKVAKSYGGGKAGNKTGWLCGKSRGDFVAPKAPDPAVLKAAADKAAADKAAAEKAAAAKAAADKAAADKAAAEKAAAAKVAEAKAKVCASVAELEKQVADLFKLYGTLDNKQGQSRKPQVKADIVAAQAKLDEAKKQCAAK